jgi:hypothetical protein
MKNDFQKSIFFLEGAEVLFQVILLNCANIRYNYKSCSDL